MKNILLKLCIILFIILIILSAVLVVLIVKDSRKESDTTENIIYPYSALRQFNPDEIHVKVLGRTGYSAGKRIFSHSGSGIEFICKGDYAEIIVCSVGEPAVSKNHQPRFAIYADGNLIVDECVDFSERTYRINTSYNGTTIRLIKLSEAMYSSFAVTSVACFGMEDIIPTEKKNMNIEFIGDSITCGYGIDAGYYGSFSTDTENFSKSYAYLTAENLNADYSAVCFSGYGVLSGYTENGIKTDKLVMNEYSKACIVPEGEFLWDFSDVQHNLVVVNLGTNDASYCANSYSGRLEFIKAYVDLIKTVREKNPSAYILCMLGDMNNSLFSSIENAVSQYISETADIRIEAFTLSYKMAENDIVIDGHPGEKSNAYAGEVLSSKIRELIYTGKVR